MRFGSDYMKKFGKNNQNLYTKTYNQARKRFYLLEIM